MSYPCIEIFCDECGNKIKRLISIKPIKDIIRSTKNRCNSCGIELNPLEFTLELEKH